MSLIHSIKSSHFLAMIVIHVQKCKLYILQIQVQICIIFTCLCFRIVAKKEKIEELMGVMLELEDMFRVSF